MRLNQIKTNQTEIRFNNGAVVFFSYNTPVAAQRAEGGFIRTREKFSSTTSRHINQWLDGAKAEEVDQSELDNLVGGV